jgi:hypothetical protein
MKYCGGWFFKDIDLRIKVKWKENQIFYGNIQEIMKCERNKVIESNLYIFRRFNNIEKYFPNIIVLKLNKAFCKKRKTLILTL